MDKDVEHRIRERAYEIWEDEGRPQGREAQHWQQAATEFAEAQEEARASVGTQARKKPAASAKSRAKAPAAGGKGAARTRGGTNDGEKPGARKPRTKKPSPSR